jgi:hypothetical protein
MRRLFVALLVLVACDTPAPPDDPGITRACIRSFAPTLKAWEAAFERVPDECRYLDGEVIVQLVSADEMPCDEPIGVNETRTECFHGDVLYLNEDLDDVALVDASVHGWTHALADCVYGAPDVDHLRARLWAVYGAETVELQAQASAEIGECL